MRLLSCNAKALFPRINPPQQPQQRRLLGAPECGAPTQTPSARINPPQQPQQRRLSGAPECGGSHPNPEGSHESTPTTATAALVGGPVCGGSHPKSNDQAQGITFRHKAVFSACFPDLRVVVLTKEICR